MADLFISYSRDDRDRCTAIRAALEELKVDVWSDSGIGAGSSFDREIEREIEAAESLLVLWSPTSVESDWVRNEARTGKEKDGLVAVQLAECDLPLEFKSIQAELLPEGGEGTDNPVWLGVVARIGELIGRPGLADYARLRETGSLEDWKQWLINNTSDPLTPGVVDNIAELAMPDMREQLAGEKTKRSSLEVQLAELSDASKAQSDEVATGARELVRLQRELDEAQSGQKNAETELAAFHEASGGKGISGDEGLAGLGIVLENRLAMYVALVLWVVAIGFCWPPLSKLIKGSGGLPDVFWIIFGLIALVVPAFVLTLKIMRKRRALANEEAEPA